MKKYFTYSNENISGSTYWIRQILNSFLIIIFGLGLYLMGLTTYKRAKAFNCDNDQALILSIIIPILMIVAMVLNSQGSGIAFFFFIPHLIFIFKNGNKVPPKKAPKSHHNKDKNVEELKIEPVVDNQSNNYKTSFNFKKTTSSKTNQYDFDQNWLDVVNGRVNAMPVNSEGSALEGIGGDALELAKSHANEYESNEFRIPKDKRIEVALDRLEGFASLVEYIKKEGSNAQKFHLYASLKGAIIYAYKFDFDLEKYEYSLASFTSF